MRFYLPAAIFILLIMTSCGEVEMPVGDKETRIKGHILLPGSDKILISKDDPYDFGSEYEVIASAKIDSNGNFSVTIPCEKAQTVQIRDENKLYLWKVYVYPGDELKIDYDNTSKDDIKVKFEGGSAPANTYVQHFASQFIKDHVYYENLSKFDLEEFSQWADNRRTEMAEYYKNYFILDSVPEIVDIIENSNINYEWAYVKNEWALRNYYYRQDRWETFELPKDYYNFLKQIKIQEPYLNFFLGRYLESLVWDWHIKQVKAGETPTAQMRETAKFEFASKNFSGLSKDIAMALCINDILVYGFDERMTEVVNVLMAEFNKQANDKGYVRGIKNVYEKRMKLLKGNPAPDFNLPNIYEAPISASDFKGKALYIYFWGTEYEPSIEILKNLMALQREFKDNKEVEFISIAMEERNFDNWKVRLKDDSLSGVQLYMENGFSNPTAKTYMINSIPFAVLVDKEGRIVSMNAPYFKNEKIAELIKSIL